MAKLFGYNDIIRLDTSPAMYEARRAAIAELQANGLTENEAERHVNAAIADHNKEIRDEQEAARTRDINKSIWQLEAERRADIEAENAAIDKAADIFAKHLPAAVADDRQRFDAAMAANNRAQAVRAAHTNYLAALEAMQREQVAEWLQRHPEFTKPFLPVRQIDVTQCEEPARPDDDNNPFATREVKVINVAELVADRA